MFKKLFILFKIARKIALSDALKIISKIHEPPLLVKIAMNILSISFTKENPPNNAAVNRAIISLVDISFICIILISY